MITQIYGLTTVEDAIEVDRLRPDHIGLVLDEGVETWDTVDEATATEIAGVIKNAKVVALSLSTDPVRVLMTADVLDPAIVHLARAHEMSDATLASLREKLAPRELMLTVPVRNGESIADAERLAPFADYLLLDTAHPSTGVVGATGLVHDWELSSQIVASAPCPVLLAGGLGPDNVAEAIRRVRPSGVDSETRTSRADDRRRKDLAKVEAFLARARTALGPRYDSFAAWYDDWVADPDADFVAQSLLRVAGEHTGERILDLGCGQGRIARTLAAHGNHVVGVDLSEELLTIAKAAGDVGITYIHADVCSLDWWDGTAFDGVICSMALMDIDDLRGALTTVATTARPGAWFAWSIIHPAFPGVGEIRPSWPTDGNYFDEGWWNTGGDGVRGRVGSNHRPLSTYLNASIEAGFALEAVEEPPWSSPAGTPMPFFFVSGWRRA